MNSRLTQTMQMLFSLGMFAVSVYLFMHYYEAYFPSQLGGSAFCSLSSFWNCDIAVFSVLGSFADVPTALFGMIVGFLLFITHVFKQPQSTVFSWYLATLNLGGCLILAIYSLLFLGGLCPGCAIYYLLSLLYWLLAIANSDRNSSPFPISWFVGAGLLLVCSFVGVRAMTKERFEQQRQSARLSVRQLQEGPNFESLIPDPPQQLYGRMKREQAELRLYVFSDFECGACKILSTTLEKIIRRYSEKVWVGYYYFPLDPSCNDAVQNEMHPNACNAARLAHCASDRFKEVHDDIYHHQQHLSFRFLSNKSHELGVAACFHSNQSLQAVRKKIDQIAPLNIEATPTIFINGFRISGLLPDQYFYSLLDGLLASTNHSKK